MYIHQLCNSTPMVFLIHQIKKKNVYTKMYRNDHLVLKIRTVRLWRSHFHIFAVYIIILKDKTRFLVRQVFVLSNHCILNDPYLEPCYKWRNVHWYVYFLINTQIWKKDLTWCCIIKIAIVRCWYFFINIYFRLEFTLPFKTTVCCYAIFD